MKDLLKIFSLSAVLCIGLSSCLKDELYTADTNDAPSIITFSEAPSASSSASNIYPVYNRAFNVVPSSDITFAVSYSGDDVAPQDINVKIAVDNAAITAYNNKIVADARAAAEEEGTDPDEAEDAVHGDLFDQMGTNLFTLNTSEVTIKKGEKSANIVISVKPELFDFSYRYGLAISITSSSLGEIADNFKTAIFFVTAKNKYDGAYSLLGRLSSVPDRPTINTSSDFAWPGDVNLVTASATEVDVYDATLNWGGGINQWVTPIGTPTGGQSAFGQVRPRIKFDLTTNKVISVVNMYSNPTNGRALKLDTSYDSKYDPETEMVDVKFIMTQPGFQDLPIHYKFTYEGSR